MKLLVDFDSAVMYYSAPQDLPEFTHAVCYHFPESTAQQYVQRNQHTDLSRELFLKGKGMVFRGSDVYAEEWSDLSDVKTSGTMRHSVHVLPAYDGKVLARISFYRSGEQQNFVYDDIFILEMIRDHMALRLSRYYEECIRLHNKLSVHECEKQYHLTARETTILGLLMQGLPNETICEQLTITNNTLKKHILNLYKKLKIRNRTQLFKMVREYEN